MSLLPAQQARWHQRAGWFARAATLLLVACLFAFYFSSDSISLKRNVLEILFLFWCVSAFFVLIVYVITGIIISTVGLNFSHLQVISRDQSPVYFWVWWLMFGLLLVLLGVLFRLGIGFVTMGVNQ